MEYNIKKVYTIYKGFNRPHLIILYMLSPLKHHKWIQLRKIQSKPNLQHSFID